MKNFLKRFDTISVLLVFFLVSIPFFIFCANRINNNIKQFSKQSTYITHLKLLDKDFNYFISKRGIITNYDIINDKINNFYTTLNYLKNNLNTNYISNNQKYIKELNKIEKDFQIKVNLIEHIKSYNSLILNSLYYLHDLKKRLHKLPIKDYDMLDDILFLSTEIFSNNLNNINILKKRLQYLKELIKNKNNKYLFYFYNDEQALLSRIIFIKNEQEIVNNQNIYERLENIYLSLKSDFNSYINISNIIILGVVLLLGLLLTTIMRL